MDNISESEVERNISEEMLVIFEEIHETLDNMQRTKDEHMCYSRRLGMWRAKLAHLLEENGRIPDSSMMEAVKLFARIKSLV